MRIYNIVACCWGVLANNEHCVHLHGPKSLTGFKLYATLSEVPTLLWFHANGYNMLGPTMLRVVGQQCWVRLHGPLEPFSLVTIKYGSDSYAQRPNTTSLSPFNSSDTNCDSEKCFSPAEATNRPQGEIAAKLLFI